jgi:hypothetical protein
MASKETLQWLGMKEMTARELFVRWEHWTLFSALAIYYVGCFGSDGNDEASEDWNGGTFYKWDVIKHPSVI